MILNVVASAQPPASLSGRCLCGGNVFRLWPQLSIKPLHIEDCHCQECRKHSGAAFASWVRVDGQIQWKGEAGLKRVKARCCGRQGALRRILCSVCLSMMAMEADARDSGSSESSCLERLRPTVEIAAGCLDDGAYTDDRQGRNNQEGVLSSTVQRQFSYSERCVDQKARYLTVPKRARRSVGGERVLVSGSCGCGGCKFEIDSFPGQLQHCYCRMCRQLSGGAFMTWGPARKSHFRWTQDASLRLRRTSRGASRHGCTECGTTLTIVYDWQVRFVCCCFLSSFSSHTCVEETRCSSCVFLNCYQSSIL